MNIHKNAHLTPLRREEMARDVVEGRLSKADAARTYVAKVVARWVERFPIEGSVGMLDRSSRPRQARSEPKPRWRMRSWRCAGSA